MLFRDYYNKEIFPHFQKNPNYVVPASNRKEFNNLLFQVKTVLKQSCDDFLVELRESEKNKISTSS